MIRYCICALMLMMLSLMSSYGQKTDPQWKGFISGVVWDKEHTTVLRASTIAIYFSENNDLIGYRLTNNYGEFSYVGLPLHIKLKLVASFIGYKSSEMTFVLKSEKQVIDLGKIDLALSSIDLDEVSIKAIPPPIRMKGDTLEFYADAYKLNPTAQTEDLLRALPGVTVWTDGLITVNGREVKSVLVNGKPFFGTDARIGTQNIPKDAVEKIQIYKKDKTPEKLTDSTTEMNIQLKKGKDIGYFGKLTGGMGGSDRYEGEASFNLFNKRSQLGFAVARNNVNKVANDIDFILRNSTYKGPGANIESQSDFRMEGDHVNSSGGLQFQHDFIDRPDFYHNNRLSGSYFTSNDDKELQRESLSIITLGNQDYFQQRNDQNSRLNTWGHQAKAAYDRVEQGKKLLMTAGFSNTRRNYSNNNYSKTDFGLNTPVSSNALNDAGDDLRKVLDFGLTYKGNNKRNRMYWHSGFDAAYSLKLEDQNTQQAISSTFNSYAQPSSNVSYDRKYENSKFSASNFVKIFLPNFGKLFFGAHLPLGIKTGFGATTKLSTANIKSIVEDRIEGTDFYAPSLYLTNEREEKIFDMVPYLALSKSIYRLLSNRYEQNFLATITSELQANDLQSNSKRSFQNFNRRYLTFNPKLDINYSSKRFGESINSLSFSAGYTNVYPTVQQLAPLVDSINMNYIQIGNLDLKPQRTAELNLSYSFSSENPLNISFWSVSLSGGYATDYFTGSNRIDNLGRMVFSTVNSDGYQFLRSTLSYKKAIKLAKHQLQFTFSPIISFEHAPNIINGIEYRYNNLILSYDPKISYSWKDVLSVNLSQRGMHNRSIERDNRENELSSFVSQSEFSFSLNVVEGLNVSSNLIYNKNVYNTRLFNEFTIWNASAAYRFLKSKVVEVKISGLDLLGQNKGLISYGSNNMITQGTVNALQRYVMLSLSYYPRKFGK